MKRAPQDLIQNKTAVFWLQYPFCSTSACQLAPLGKGRESRDFFGEQREKIPGNRSLESSNSRERGNQNIQVLGEHWMRPSAAWGLSQTLWAPEVCTPHPSLLPIPPPCRAAQESPTGEGNSHSRINPSQLLACPWAVGQQRGNDLSGDVVIPHPCSQNKKSLLFSLGKGKIK